MFLISVGRKGKKKHWLLVNSQRAVETTSATNVEDGNHTTTQCGIWVKVFYSGCRGGRMNGGKPLRVTALLVNEEDCKERWLVH